MVELSAHADDLEAIRQTALDYVEGWYEGDAHRIGRSLHPSLVKRGLKQELPSGALYLNYLTREEMVAATTNDGGSRVPVGQRLYDIAILDVFQEIATVRADNPHWVDYLHLVKMDGRWVIVNVLYGAKPESDLTA